MTRQRTRPSLIQTYSVPCPTCKGFGRVLSYETIATKIERWFQRAKAAVKTRKFELVVHPDVAKYITDPETDIFRRFSKQLRFKITLVEDDTLSPENYKVISLDDNLEVTDLYKTKAEMK